MMSKQYFGSKMNESRVFEQTYFFLETPLPVGAEVTLISDFIGIHNDKMAGFYRSGYTDNDGNKK